MSETQSQGNGTGTRQFLPVTPQGERRLPAPLAKLGQAELEQSAQVLGWRPKEQWQGDPGAFRDAKTFLEQAFTSDDDRIARNNLTQALGAHRTLQAETAAANARLNEALETINGLTTQFRAFSDGGFQRTRADLAAQRTAAVAAGDTVEFERLDTQLRELDDTHRAGATARRPAPGDRGTGDQPGAGTGTGGDQRQQSVVIPPDAKAAVAEWGRNNPWYFTEPDMREYTDRYDTYLRTTSPDIGPIEHLKQLSQAVGKRFPGQLPGQEGQGNGAGAGGGDGGGGRRQASDVDGGDGLNGGGGGGRNRRDFASMPQESKTQYKRYAGLLKGKGEPLTETEWAASYWAQFPEV
jgi:hypothetical protein